MRPALETNMEGVAKSRQVPTGSVQYSSRKAIASAHAVHPIEPKTLQQSNLKISNKAI